MFRLDARRAAVLPALLGILAFAASVVPVCAQQPVLNLGDLVTTGFSGIVRPDPALPIPAGKTVVDLTFIDTAAPAARIVDVSHAGAAFDAPVLAPLHKLDVLARDVGQVFGIAIDDEKFPNIYLTATSTFGLNIVAPGASGTLERSKTGSPGAQWMKGQFGLDLGGGPGSIWKVDGLSGAVSLFTDVALDGKFNPGPGLGNIAYDAAHKQLFVSDAYTGMIHRFDLAGNDLGHFDHGLDGRPIEGLAPVAFDPNAPLDITGPFFDSENPDSWGYAPSERRVWGLVVHDGRLFYTVAAGPQVWSIGIAVDGSFDGDPRWELDVATDTGPFPVSDMTFSNAGAMILAQRAPVVASYDFSAFTEMTDPRVLVYWRESPDDPTTPSRWMSFPEEYAIGFPNNSRNTNGGVDLGYGYDETGVLNIGACETVLWNTGQKLRDDAALAVRLRPGGPLLIDGLQASPADQVREANTPPWLSYFVDYDEMYEDVTAVGHMGSVRTVKRPCSGITYGGPPPPVVGGCVGGPNCPPPPPNACFESKGALVCDPKSGHWVYVLSVNGPTWINTITAVSLAPGVGVPGGPVSLNPASIPLTGAPGATAIIEVCAFDAGAAASGKPYDCCRTQVRVTIPNLACGTKP